MRRASMTGARGAERDSFGLLRRKGAAVLGLAGLLALCVLAPPPGLAQEAPHGQIDRLEADKAYGSLFDAVVERISKSFWDKDLLAASGWERRAAEVRQSVIEAPTHTEAARRINALLGELQDLAYGAADPRRRRVLHPARCVLGRKPRARIRFAAVLGRRRALRWRGFFLGAQRWARLCRCRARRLARRARGPEGR